MLVNFVAAVLYAVAAAFAKQWADLAAYVYFGTAVIYGGAVVAKVHGDRKMCHAMRDYRILRIQEPGTYRLTRDFVALASKPTKFLDAGFIFQVTEVAAEFVVFIPQFGGWTYCEIPAERVEDSSSRPLDESK